MITKLLLALLICLSLSGCEMEKVPEIVPEQIENERYDSILDKFRVEPTDDPVSTCLDVKIDNLAYDSSEWTLELPKINSSKPVAEKINETIFTKYTERFRDEIEELTETRKSESQHRTRYFSSESDGFVYIEINVLSGADNSAETETIYYDSTNDNELGMFEFFDALVGDDYTISDYVKFAEKVCGYELTVEDIKKIRLNDSTLELDFGKCFIQFFPDIPIPSEVSLPDGEPLLERAPLLSGLKFRYYAGNGAKFYWSRTGNVWFDYTIFMPDGAENVEIYDFTNGNSCEATVWLKAEINGETTYFTSAIDAYFMPPLIDDVHIDQTHTSNS